MPLTTDFLKDAHIVIIDDDSNSLDVASIVLEYAGATKIELASNGKEGIDIVYKTEPQLILCDLSMPIMDGWEFIKLIRQNQVYNEVPVIALTAHAMVGDHERVLSAGFNGYLTKPIEPTTFVKQLLGVLSKLGNEFLSSSLTKE